MRVYCLLICFTIAAYACNSGDKAADVAATTQTTTDAPVIAGNASSSADNEKGLDLIVKSDCTTCHKIEEKLTGPAYRDVANKYTADEQTISMLANKVITGGKGVWGQIPMTPHPTLSIEDSKEMVKYVLSLKNK